jgi:Zn-finger nucleic acid-binding protein
MGRVMSILVVTGASGAGKTAAVQALAARNLPGVRCFYFDSIGVPSADVMQREYGGGDAWQAWATQEWLTRIGALAALPDGVRVAVLEGQTRPSLVVGLTGSVPRCDVGVILLDCSADVRNARLRGARQQPELATDRMDDWAAYLRGEAATLKLPVIETTALAPDEVADYLEAMIRRCGDVVPNASGTALQVRCPGPGCRGTMTPETRDGITVDRCERCHGLWFDARELDQWLAGLLPADSPPPEGRIPRRGRGTRQCPHCVETLETAGWTGLVLDRCPNCRGLFVEVHELAQMEGGGLPDERVDFELRLRKALHAVGYTLLSADIILLLLLRFLRRS